MRTFFNLALILSLAITQLNFQVNGKPDETLSTTRHSALNGNETAFEEFRKTVLSAIARKDKQFIINMLSPKILTALGGETGKEAFAKTWHDLSPESEFWQRIERVLKHGAQFDDGTNEFHAPAINFADTHSELPQAIIWDRDALLYKDPSTLAGGVKAPFLEQITLLEPADPEPVRKAISKIKDNKGQVFYIKSMHIYSAYDEFAVFKKQDGRWQLTWFGYAGL